MVAAHAHQEAQSGLADRPDILLSRRIEHDHRVGGGANAAGDEVFLEAIGFLHQLGVALAVVLDHEHGGGIAFDHRDLARKPGCDRVKLISMRPISSTAEGSVSRITGVAAMEATSSSN